MSDRCLPAHARSPSAARQSERSPRHQRSRSAVLQIRAPKPIWCVVSLRLGVVKRPKCPNFADVALPVCDCSNIRHLREAILLPPQVTSVAPSGLLYTEAEGGIPRTPFACRRMSPRSRHWQPAADGQVTDQLTASRSSVLELRMNLRFISASSCTGTHWACIGNWL